MDRQTEALIGPERPQDPAKARALARQVEEEDFTERVRLARYGGPLLLFFAAILYPLAYPLLHSLPRLPGAWRLFGWVFLNVPLITLAVLVLRRGRFPLGRGRFLTGKPARRAAFALLAVSLFLFFWLDVLRVLWGWIAPTGW